jgi:CheY-like chemotaxis protein/HPt (histidine-containing phosphotransfer) domain-containing protein
MEPRVENSKGAQARVVAGLPLGCRVLLAEDTFDSRRLLTIVLGKAGAEVVAVDHGQAAVERTQEALREGRPFDAVVLDMAMPILNGYEAAQRMRGAGYQGPIVALTAHVLPGEREKCLAAGCDDYVGKPVDRGLLITTLARHMASRSAPSVSPPSDPSKPAKSLLESLPEAERTRLLKDFVGGLVERVGQMEAAWRQQDTDNLIYLAHSIHGTAYLFSFPDIAASAGAIERGLRNEAPIEQLEPDMTRLAGLCREAAAKL